MNARLRRAWQIIIVAALLICGLLVAVGGWNTAAFSLLWGFGVGGACYRWREEIHAALASAHLITYAGFVLVVTVVSVVEESLCAGFGCQLAVKNYWADLFVVTCLWVAWLTGWYFLIAPRFKFTYEEALLVAASTGIMFEAVGNGRAFADPVGSLLALPLVIVVYAGITAVPIRMLEFKGTREGRSKYPIAFFVPYLLVLPVAVPVFIIVSLAGGLGP